MPFLFLLALAGLAFAMSKKTSGTMSAPSALPPLPSSSPPSAPIAAAQGPWVYWIVYLWAVDADTGQGAWQVIAQGWVPAMQAGLGVNDRAAGLALGAYFVVITYDPSQGWSESCLMLDGDCVR
jgi:hypothetical protein